MEKDMIKFITLYIQTQNKFYIFKQKPYTNITYIITLSTKETTKPIKEIESNK